MVGPAFSLKLVGPWTVLGKKNESGPNTTWSTPTWAKQRNGSCGWLTASAAVAGSANSTTAEPTTDARAAAPAVIRRETGLTKPRVTACIGFFISVLLPCAGRQSDRRQPIA